MRPRYTFRSSGEVLPDLSKSDESTVADERSRSAARRASRSAYSNRP